MSLPQETISLPSETPDTISERRSCPELDESHKNNNNYGEFLKPPLPDRTKQHSEVRLPPPAEMVTTVEIDRLERERERERETKPRPKITLCAKMPNTPAFWMDLYIGNVAHKSTNVSQPWLLLILRARIGGFLAVASENFAYCWRSGCSRRCA